MNRGLPLLLAGFTLAVISIAGLIQDVAWIAQPFYSWAWWSFILLLDGFCVLKRGRSLLTTRRRVALPLAIASVTFWFAFEALNLRFRNWYYVGCYELEEWTDYLVCGIFGITAFATVFIGIFETIDALGASGLWRDWRRDRRRLPSWTSWAVQGLGFTMAALAVLFPYWLAPLIWGSLSFLLDPWNYRAGRRSFLGDIERGEFGRVARVFLGGLICGFVWESLNFIAPQKWIYTVHGLENLKLFEMPLLGFLGFPALALDCVSFASLFSTWCLGNQTWEDPDDALQELPDTPPHRRGFYLSLPLQAGFCILVAYGINLTNVGSVAVKLDDLQALPEAAREQLIKEGIARPRRLARALARADRQSMLSNVGLDGEAADQVLQELELYEFKGIGAGWGRVLKAVGVTSIDELRKSTAEDLHGALTELTGSDDEPPLEWVRVWVLASRSRGVLLRSTGESERTAGP